MGETAQNKSLSIPSSEVLRPRLSVQRQLLEFKHQLKMLQALVIFLSQEHSTCIFYTIVFLPGEFHEQTPRVIYLGVEFLGCIITI